jgi:hypothetical protein
MEDGSLSDSYISYKDNSHINLDTSYRGSKNLNDISNLHTSMEEYSRSYLNAEQFEDNICCVELTNNNNILVRYEDDWTIGDVNIFL